MVVQQCQTNTDREHGKILTYGSYGPYELKMASRIVRTVQIVRSYDPYGSYEHGSYEPCFFSREKNTTTWLYVTLTGDITIRNILEKNDRLRIGPNHMVHEFDDFALKLLFPC